MSASVYFLVENTCHLLRRIQRLILTIFSKTYLFIYAVLSFSLTYCSETDSPLLLKAQTVFREIHSGKATSKYSHANQVLYEMNCYGFLNYLIQETSPEAFREILTAMEELKETTPPSVDGMPCPFNYAAALKHQKLKHWEMMKQIEEVQPGDILIYLPPNFEPQESFEIGQKPPRIHMMVVERVFPSKENLFHFSIIDCTRIPHNRIDDTRYPKKSGIGRSSLFLEKRGDDFALRWRADGPVQMKEMVFARLRTPPL